MSEEIKKLLTDLSRRRIDLLSMAQKGSLKKALDSALAQLQKAEESNAIHRIQESIHMENRGCFAESLKRRGKGKKLAVDYEAALAETNRIVSQYRPMLQILRKASEGEALKKLANASAEDRLWLSLLANVSSAKGTLLKLTTSPKNHAHWKRGLSAH